MSYLDSFRLDGRVALVTGGSRGLGLEIATALAHAGARVAVAARRREFLDEALHALQDAYPIVLDVANEGEVIQAVEETTRALGAPSILVNAAGISWGARAEEMPAEKLREVLAVNLEGAFYACKAVFPAMAQAGYGKIINVSSVAGIDGQPEAILSASGYSASKGGLNALTRDLAVKWGPKGIRVNALAPGFFPTRLTEKLLPRIEGLLRATLPLGRPGRPGEIGPAALFLASPASDYVTGHILVVDGGGTAQ